MTKSEEFDQWRARLVEDPGILGGEPVFPNSRLGVRHVGEMLERGESREVVLEDYPYLTDEDLDHARHFVRLYPRAGRSVGQPSREEKQIALLTAITRELSTLEALLEKVNGEWRYEDGVYRFYRHSFKVYRMQRLTEETVATLRALMPDHELCEDFTQIVAEGTGKTWERAHNAEWDRHTRPILEAFFHARYFLEMVVKYGKQPEGLLHTRPSGWAAVLRLYATR